MMRQVMTGNGLLAFRDLAARLLQPAELLLALRKALRAGPTCGMPGRPSFASCGSWCNSTKLWNSLVRRWIAFPWWRIYGWILRMFIKHAWTRMRPSKP